MKDGAAIRNNKASVTTTLGSGGAYGGGVYLSSAGTFTMEGGMIGGNIAINTRSSSSTNGGGVAVQHSGSTFTISGGVIYGNEGEVAENLKNKAANGAALYRSSYGGNVTAQKKMPNGDLVDLGDKVDATLDLRP
jgi:hypothetical protein